MYVSNRLFYNSRKKMCFINKKTCLEYQPTIQFINVVNTLPSTNYIFITVYIKINFFLSTFYVLMFW